MCKQYFYTVLLAGTILHIISVRSEGSMPYADKVNSIASDNSKNPKSNVSEKPESDFVPVPVEGGGTFNLTNHQQTLASSSTTTQTVIEKTVLSNVTSPPLNHKASRIDNSSAIEVQKPGIEPVTESTETVGNSKIHPRKGVDFNNITSLPVDLTTVKVLNVSVVTKPSTSTTTPTTTKFLPRKPKVTVGSDEEDPPPRLFINGKEILSKNTSTANKKNAMDDENVIITNRRVDKGSYYVLPIVLTILAVPLLAIILTVGYKRGAEWWQHRHYRRMDFLIDGMYNN